MNRSLFLFAATAGLLLATNVFSERSTRRIAEPLITPLAQVAGQIEGWKAMGDQTLPAPTLHALAPTAYLARKYEKETIPLEVFIAYYAQQRAGESMHSPKHCLPGAGWEIWKHDSAMVPLRGKQFEINKYSIQNSGTRMLMFYWYQSKTRIVSSEYLAKVLLARDTIVSGHTAGSIVRIMLPDTPANEQEGIRFASQLIPEVERCFGSQVVK